MLQDLRYHISGLAGDKNTGTAVQMCLLLRLRKHQNKHQRKSPVTLQAGSAVNTLQTAGTHSAIAALYGFRQTFRPSEMALGARLGHAYDHDACV